MQRVSNESLIVVLLVGVITLVWRESLMWQAVAFVVHVCSLKVRVRSVCSLVFDDWRWVLGVSVVLWVACYCCVAGWRASLLTIAVHVWCVW